MAFISRQDIIEDFAMSNKLVGVEELISVLTVVVNTANIQHTIPISAAVIGPSGAGKSKLLLSLECNHIRRADDLTAAGLYDLLKEDEREQAVKFIVVPDFNMVLSHKESVLKLLIGSLLGITADGIMEIRDGRQNKKLSHAAVAIIFAMTTDMYQQHYKMLCKVGMVRRLLPLHYTYGIETIHNAQRAIASQQITLMPIDKNNIKVIAKPQNPRISEKMAAEIENLSLLATSKTAKWIVFRKSNSKWIKEWVRDKDGLPFTWHQNLRTMAKSHAALSGRVEVNDDDAKFLRLLLEYCDPESPRRL